MKSVGIDIGTGSIKAVEIQTTSKGYVVSQYFIHQLSKNPAHDRDIEIIEFLRELAQRYDLSKTKFVLSLRQDQVALRNKVFPFSERLKILRTLPIELEEDIPFSSENSIYDAKIIRTSGNSAEVLACAAPKQHISKLLSLISDSNINADIISCEGVAFANLFEKWNDPPPNVPNLAGAFTDGFRAERPINIILNIGYHHTVVTAYEKNTLIGVRSILWGGKNIAEAISRKYEIPFLEALKEMELKAFILTTKQETSLDAKVFSDTIAKSVREFVRDLQLSLLEFRSEFNGTIIKIEMTGGVSLIQGLGPFLTQMLEVPVNRIRILDSLPNIYFEKTDITDTRLGVALGLAIEGLKKPRNPAINFLKNEFARQNNNFKDFIHRWGKTIQLSAALIVVLYIWSFLRVDFSTRLLEASQDLIKTQGKRVAGLSAKTANEKGVRDFIKTNSKKIQDFKTVQNVYQMNSAIAILKTVSERVPLKNKIALDVKRFSVIESDVVIEGYVNNEQEANTLIEALRYVAVDGQVKPTRMSYGPMPGKKYFALTFQVDRNIQKAGL